MVQKLGDLTFLKWSQRIGRQGVGFNRCNCDTPGLICLLAEKANLEKKGNGKNQNQIHFEAFHSGSSWYMLP